MMIHDDSSSNEKILTFSSKSILIRYLVDGIKKWIQFFQNFVENLMGFLNENSNWNKWSLFRETKIEEPRKVCGAQLVC